MPPLTALTAICDPDLLRKYDISGPRYTSYPTAAEFDQAFTQREFINAAQDSGKQDPLSLYFHLPFCHSICYYCACNKIVTRKRSQSGFYLEYLEKEIVLMDQLDWQRRPVTQLHWGGGTPTFFSNEEMASLMETTAKHFNLLSGNEREYSIEIDPRTVDRERLEVLKDLGFNRLSLGIQDFDTDVQKAVNRIQPFDTVKQQVDDIRKLAYRSINFDLIYGLPFQNEQTVTETVRKVVELSPDRISCYNYAHLPHRFKTQRSIDRQRLPSPDEKIRMFSTVVNGLAEAGYIYVGMDHFVKPDDTLAQALSDGKLMRNFQGYSVNLASDMLSMGVSSISSFNRAFAQNYRKLESYYEALDQGRLPIEHGVQLSDDDKLRADIIQQITCHRYVNFKAIEERYQLDFHQYFADSLKQLEPLKEDGIVNIDENSLTVTESGYLFLRHIAMAFDRYLAKSKAQYSKAI